MSRKRRRRSGLCAKTKIRDAGIPYEVPRHEDLPERIAAVLETVYLIFNEGYSAAEAESYLRPDLCREAIRLGRLIIELLPNEAEPRGLTALMLLHHARRAARVGADGGIVPLEEQDRSTWDRGEIREGTAILDEAVAMRRSGTYQIQAAIAALHANAPTPADTDWPQIAALYGGLVRRMPTPVIQLNAAVALAMCGRFDDGLDWVNRLAQFRRSSRLSPTLGGPSGFVAAGGPKSGGFAGLPAGAGTGEIEGRASLP